MAIKAGAIGFRSGFINVDYSVRVCALGIPFLHLCFIYRNIASHFTIRHLTCSLVFTVVFFMQKDIKQHVFFISIDWLKLDAKKVVPPFNPKVVNLSSLLIERVHK